MADTSQLKGVDLIEQKNWHHYSAEHAIDKLLSRDSGLLTPEISERQLKYGLNQTERKASVNQLKRFLAQFNNLLIYILIGAASITFFLGMLLDTLVILAVVMINAAIGYFQEGKAEESLKAIQKYLVLKTLALRDGQWQLIDAYMLVPGDIVKLKAGDKVPADLRLINAHLLQAQEAVLTGESFPVEKSPLPVAEDAILGDQSSMLFAGTMITAGQGVGVVVATGTQTQIGRISETLKETKPPETPLERQIRIFNRWITFGILVGATLIFIHGLYFGQLPFQDLFIATVSLTVAAIPEGLPVIMTITMATGVIRMAAKNAIVRQLPAVETLGSVNVICTDKTGTLTKNELTAQTIVTLTNEYVVTGVGYMPVGEILLNDIEAAITPSHELYPLLQAASLCNDAELYTDSPVPRVSGAPLDAALLTLVYKADLDPTILRQQYPRFDVIPFSSEEKLMATLHSNISGEKTIFIKGAPEVLVQYCQFTDAGELNYWQDNFSLFASKGMRLLGLAQKPCNQEKTKLMREDIIGGCTFLGFLAFIDPPREDTKHAIDVCRKAGIEVKMITGDHVQTALAIAEQIDLVQNPVVLSGKELDNLQGSKLVKAAQETHVFARVSSLHKLKLIEALQSQNQVIAMTGDGVNDAPALKRADISISMGLKGAEAAKEASKMVLADDRFSTIVDAIREGRTVFDNLKKSIVFILPSNAGEASILLIALFLGITMPITPLQILWINTITAVTLGVALAFERPEPDLMEKPPRGQKDPILSKHLTWRLFYVAMLMVMASFGSFYYSLSQGVDIETARTITVNTIVGCEIVYLINCRNLKASDLGSLFGNMIAIYAILAVSIIQFGFTYLSIFHYTFQTVSVDMHYWLISFACALSLFIAVELEKAIYNRFGSRKGT